MEVNSLFATPIGMFTRSEELTNEEYDYVRATAWKPNRYNKIGQDAMLLNHKPLKNIKNFIEQSISRYMDLYKIQYRLRICASWANKTEPGQSHHRHNHPNSILSGVYYLQDLKSCPIEFYHPSHPFSGFEIMSNREEDITYFSSSSWLMDNLKANQCIIFPSTLEHSVPGNYSDENRYSIAFNVFLDKNQVIGDGATYLEV